MSELLIGIGDPCKVKDFRGPQGIAFKEIIPRRPEGRPTVMTPEVLDKLEFAFMHAMSDKEACFYANISPATLYSYQSKHPEFAERKEELKLDPNIKAKIKLVKDIPDSLDQSRWWAQHRMHDDFTTKTILEHSGEITQRTDVTPEVAKAINDANVALREAIAAPHKPV